LFVLPAASARALGEFFCHAHHALVIFRAHVCCMIPQCSSLFPSPPTGLNAANTGQITGGGSWQSAENISRQLVAHRAQPAFAG